MIAIIVQARVASTRLPGKVLKKINGKTLLEILISRLRHCKTVKKIIIATTKNPKDKKIVALAKKLKTPVFQGSENDVLDRYYKAAEKHKVKDIVRITGDCSFIDPVIIDKVAGVYKKNKRNVDYVSNVHPATFPDGMDVEVFSFKALEKTWRSASLSSEREHVTSYIVNHPKIFHTKNISYKKNFSNLRLTIDNKEDLILAKNLFNILKNNKRFGLEDILNIWRTNPDVFFINQRYKRNEGYIKSLETDLDNLNIRKATYKDLKFIFNLRNEEKVRLKSFNNKPICLKEHRQWFKKNLTDKNSIIYIIDIKNLPIAQVRFNFVKEKEAEINIAVIKDFRNRGYGTEILKRTSNNFLEEFPQIKTIYAFIKSDNKASRRSFEKAGFLFGKNTVKKGNKCIEMFLNKT